MNDKRRRFAFVITHMGKGKGMVDMPWLETEYHIDESDWVVLSNDGWRALASGGDPGLWEALERKLLVGFHVSHPQLIAVVGHPSGPAGADVDAEGQDRVRRIVSHIESLLLPAAVLGFWTDQDGSLQDVLEATRIAGNEQLAFAGEGAS